MTGTHFSDLLALGFQGVVTIALALVHLALWRQGRGRAHLTWGLAWLFYALRLLFISVFIVDRREVWLFAHQAATGLTALLLLWAALQFSRARAGARLRGCCRRWRWLWAWFAVFRMHDMAIAGTSGAVLLSAVTLWTGVVFWRLYARDRSSRGADAGVDVLAVGAAPSRLPAAAHARARRCCYGVFVDVLLIVVAAIGTLSLVLGEERRALAERNAQLEQLTRLLLRAQEDERRRIARELHDEAGQVLTAVKIELDLEGRNEASALVVAGARPGARREQPAAPAGARRPRAAAGAARAGRGLRAPHAHRASTSSCDLGGTRVFARRAGGDLPRGAGGAHQRRAPRGREPGARCGLRREGDTLLTRDRGRRPGRGRDADAAPGPARHARARHRAGRRARDRDAARARASGSRRGCRWERMG